MKILLLCHRIPFPPIDGGNIAIRNLATALVTCGNQVKIISLNTIKHFVEPASLPESLKYEMKLEAIAVDTSVTPIGALLNLFTKKSYNITRFFSKTFEKRLKNILIENEYDIIQLESLFMVPYLPCIRQYSKSKVAMRAHNVEHVIWNQLHRSEKNIFKKWYLKHLAKRLKYFEVQHLNNLDAILPITMEDAAVFRSLGCTIPMLVTPLGIDLKEYETKAELNTEQCLFHLGSMQWLPNQEGVTWFLENCWQMIHAEFPELKLYLAGRGFPKQIVDAGYPQVICEGEILDSNKYSENKQIMIVPLLAGSGMRVKMLL